MPNDIGSKPNLFSTLRSRDPGVDSPCLYSQASAADNHGLLQRTCAQRVQLQGEATLSTRSTSVILRTPMLPNLLCSHREPQAAHH